MIWKDSSLYPYVFLILLIFNIISKNQKKFPQKYLETPSKYFLRGFIAQLCRRSHKNTINIINTRNPKVYKIFAIKNF